MTKKSPNENLLKGMKCPECSYAVDFIIRAEADFIVWDTGCQLAVDAQIDWRNDSLCFCPNCNHEGKVRDFKEVCHAQQ